MKRLLIFPALFPPLALLVFVIPDAIIRSEFPPLGMLFWLLGYAYPIAVIPALLTAGTDWAFAKRPFYLRVVASAVVGTMLAVVTAHYLGQQADVLIGLMGAIPAAVCSLLSTLLNKLMPPLPSTPQGGS